MTAVISTRGPGQAVRPAARGRRHRPRRARRRRLRLPRRQRVGQDDHRPHAARAWCCPPAGRSSCSASRMPRAGRRVLPRVGALIEGPAHYGHLSGRENLALLDAAGPRRLLAHPPAPDRRGARAGRARRGRPAAGQGVLARHAAAARAGRRAAAPSRAAGARRADQRPGPAGHHRDPRAAAGAAPRRDDGLPVQPPAGRGRAAVHPGRRARPRPAGAAGRAGHADRARPARPWCRPRRPTGCAPRWTAGSRRSTASGVVVRGGDPAEVNAAAGRAPASRSPGWRWSARRWRRWCWPRPGTSTDRVEAESR